MPPDPDPPRRRDDRQPTPWKVEGAPETKKQGPMGMPRPPGGRRFLYFVVGLLVLNFIFASLVPSKPSRATVPYTQFLTQVDKGNVAELTSQGDKIEGTFKTKVTPEKFNGKQDKPNTRFSTLRPALAPANDPLLSELRAKGVVVNAKPLDSGRSFIADLLLFFGPTLLLVALFVFMARRAAASGGMGGLGGLGRSRAKRYDSADQTRTTFADVAGIDEAEDELEEVVDFLKNPEKYRTLGAMIPKGVLLSGQPGTGKTLLARAVAGEADVPFFSISASEFIEMVVGVGASRVRDLFTQAKAAAPSIIFIDELDAIGRQRGGGASLGGHDEREQTLNQILTEMDGFTGSEGVIVLASTNRPDVLDSALLRPGRFDRRVTVNPPDVVGREKILQVHTRSVPLDDDVDLKGLAATTPGMVGADLRNLVNEAALLAAKNGHPKVTSGDFYNAFEKIVLGTERRITLSHEERERTAYHEGGHALLGMLEPGADPVRKVSIVPRGRALGVTFQSPENDRYGYDTAYLLGRITGALGGRAAEEIVYGSVTTGAESDLEQVTHIARSMVGRWGMSDVIGLVSVMPPAGEQVYPGTDPSSEATRELIDREVRRIIEECYGRAVEQLREHRDRLDSLAAALLERETLDENDAYRAAGFERGSAPGDRPPHGLLKEPSNADATPSSDLV
ncbi:ATP-dependent zinc metalloprotease FtsH [Baekduia soli]|uniref:ATP-dependent zinc metalloprotease FtsH n=1 Tax=Baekduia soli TaxID=496014 RepID=A0A5B8TZQ4_9ACTN|nr:ATP-dependent zinc metalloprotease FtsH [Baekduia soli]QEC46210.1 ATP-dependent zinc metalloprotease FtsH [Baekduia soli]